jgi:hypothetical protein
MIELFEIFNALVEYLPNYILYDALIAVGAYLVIYAFRAVGLFTLARRAGIGHAWFGFVPLLNSYLVGELAGTSSFASMKIKRIGLWYCLSEGVACIAYVLSDIAVLSLYGSGATYNAEVGSWVSVAEDLAWAQTMDGVMSYILLVLQLVYIFFFVLAVMGFFRKYAARNAGIFSVASIFVPIVYSILVFVVRNNAPIDYEQYVRDRRDAYYRQSAAYRNAQQYSDPYSEQRQRRNPAQEDDVFREFSSSDSSSNSSSDNENDQFFG